MSRPGLMQPPAAQERVESMRWTGVGDEPEQYMKCIFRSLRVV